jgi:cobalt/nickel transport system permease protein
MHLADGTLANQVCTITAVGSATAVAVAAAHARHHVSRRNVIRVALGATLVFAAQMVDVPLFGGTAVHLIGAALLVALAGPALALLAMTAVISVQALVLNDGGVTALGANVMNMGVVAVGVAWLALYAMRGARANSLPAVGAIALASVASVFAAVTAMALELAFSGTPLGDAFAITMTAHAPFAAWETLITAAFALVVLRHRAVAPVRVAETD